MADPTVTSLAAAGSATASTQVDFSAQAAGTLLVLTVGADTVKSGDPSGWTLLQSGVDFVGSYVWYKLASGSETSVTYVLDGAASSAYSLIAADNITQTLPVDVSNVSHNHGSNPFATPTVATSSGRRLALACWAGRLAGPSGGGRTYSNSYTEASYGATGNFEAAVGKLVFDGGGSTTTTINAEASVVCLYAVTAVFKVAEAAGADVTAVSGAATAAATGPHMGAALTVTGTTHLTG